MPIGRSLLTTSTVFPTRVSADGRPQYKTGGAMIAWSTVAALGADATLPDGSIIKTGLKYLRYGQIMCEITTATLLTLTGTATGGTFTITMLRPDTGQYVTTATIAYNASAATVLAAVQAVLGPATAITATGGALGSAPVPVTFTTYMPNWTINTGSLTGGTVTSAVTTAGLTGGWYGPYDSAASDGRQTLTRGRCFALDETILEYSGVGSQLGVQQDFVGGCIEGGYVFVDRILNAGSGSASLAAGPTRANLDTAFPNFNYVEM